MSIWRVEKRTGKLAQYNDINQLINSKEWYTEQVVNKDNGEVDYEK